MVIEAELVGGGVVGSCGAPLGQLGLEPRANGRFVLSFGRSRMAVKVLTEVCIGSGVSSTKHGWCAQQNESHEDSGSAQDHDGEFGGDERNLRVASKCIV